MTAAYFEDHPTDPDKVILRKPKHESTWVGLTDDEVYKIAFALEGEHWRKIANAIADKLREKNS